MFSFLPLHFKPAALTAVMLVLAAVSTLRADTVTLKNGDKFNRNRCQTGQWQTYF
jgi:hypothetical protein